MPSHTRSSHYRRVVPVVIALAIVATLVAPVRPSGAAPAELPPPDRELTVAAQFSDVPPTQAFADPIGWMVDHQITNGYPDGTFRPTAPVTRLSVAAFLYRFADSPNGATPTCTAAPFNDVPADHPFCGQIKWMADEQISSGYPDGGFHPTDPVTRQSMAAFLYRTMGSPDGVNPTCASPLMPDIAAEHPFCGQVSWALTNGITTGYSDGTYRPSAAMTRQSAAAFLHRAPSKAVAISGGNHLSCAALENGTVRCWGRNDFGELGDPAGPTSSNKPLTVKWVHTAVQVSAGDEHACALLANGTVMCWGHNFYGQVGHGAVGVDQVLPAALVPGITGATSLSSAKWSNCVVLANHTVKCWGMGQTGALGNGTFNDSVSPVDVTGISNASTVSVGFDHACAVLTNHSVKCWGFGGNGALGTGFTTDEPAPVVVPGITTATSVTAGANHTCVTLSNGTVSCWGWNTDGQLGRELPPPAFKSLSPGLVTGLTSVARVDAADYSTCVTFTNHNVSCFGNNEYGTLGNGGTDDSTTPVAVTGLSAAQLGAGSIHVCAISTTGDVLCWGNNLVGELGDGTNNESHTPVGVHGLS